MFAITANSQYMQVTLPHSQSLVWLGLSCLLAVARSNHLLKRCSSPSRATAFLLVGARSVRSLPVNIFPFIYWLRYASPWTAEKLFTSLSCLAPCLGQLPAGISAGEQPHGQPSCPARSRPFIAEFFGHRLRQMSRSKMRPLRSRTALAKSSVCCPGQALRPSPAFYRATSNILQGGFLSLRAHQPSAITAPSIL